MYWRPSRKAAIEAFWTMTRLTEGDDRGLQIVALQIACWSRSIIEQEDL